MIISKALSLIREIAIAGFFGVTSSTDAYFVAAGFVTNIFFGITIALSTVFLPYYIQSKKNKTRDELSREFSSLFSSLLVFSLIIILLLYFLAPIIVKLIAPTYIDQIFHETVLYLRIYSISILFSLLTNMLTALFNAEKRYGFGAIASLVYSLTSIIFMVLLKDIFGVASLVISIPVSFFIQLLILLFNVRKYIKIKLTFRQIMNPTVKKILSLMIPVLLSSATIQINQLLTRSIATGLEEGSVSILSYSSTLFNFVSTLIMTSFITVMFTEFSTAVKDNDNLRMSSLMTKSINIIVIILIPISVITLIYSNDIVSIAYGRGAFDSNSVRLTAVCLSIYAVAFVFDSIRNLFVKAFYSSNNMRTPLINSIISFVITVGLSLLLSKILGIYGIILAIVISIILSAIFLGYSAQNKIVTFQGYTLFTTAWKVLLSSIITVFILILIKSYTDNIPSIFRFLIAISSGFTVYFGILTILKCSEILHLIKTIYNKIKTRA
jgi:putative peptidoglycan lipid II flippase